MAAVALVLIPYGMERAETLHAAVVFLAGGIIFWRFDHWMKRNGGTASQFMGMTLDFVPEGIALGARLKNKNYPAIGAVTGFLLGMIGTALIH